MARENFELYCSHCPADVAGKTGGYFIVNFEMTRRGQFLFVCPNCNREHARTIRDGEMQSNKYEARFIGGTGKVAVHHDGGGHRPGWPRILVQKSAWSKKPRLELTKIVPCGFLSDAWLRKTAAEKG